MGSCGDLGSGGVHTQVRALHVPPARRAAQIPPIEQKTYVRTTFRRDILQWLSYWTLSGSFAQGVGALGFVRMIEIQSTKAKTCTHSKQHRHDTNDVLFSFYISCVWTRRGLFLVRMKFPCVVLWRPEALDCRVLIIYYDHIASIRMTPVLREAMLFILNHGILLLHITVNMCPAEFAKIVWSHVKHAVVPARYL